MKTHSHMGWMGNGAKNTSFSLLPLALWTQHVSEVEFILGRDEGMIAGADMELQD